MTANPIRILLTIFLSLLLTTAVFAQTEPKIAKIETEGLKALTTETVIATSGLKIGDTFSVAALDAASERLLSSGLFKKVGYRTRNVAGNVTITFQLEELKGQLSPVVFDNFIWFSDEELTAAIKREVPSFSGSAPDVGNTNDAIKQALQNLLAERKLPGKVEYHLTEHDHLFRVTGVPMKICTLHFPGAQDVPEKKLIEATRSSMDPEYSRQSVQTFPKFGLYPIYRELGHLRASFGDPIAKPANKDGCEGVDLTIPVDEGAVYSWVKAEWFGNQVLSTKELDDALGMKAGEVANGKKFDTGLKEVRNAYGKHGYILIRLNPAEEFDEGAPKVTFKIAITEGAQYRMGAVEFRGFSADDAFILNKKWGLRSGEVYDRSYAAEFLRTNAGEIMSRIARDRESQRKPVPNLSLNENVNSQALTVDLLVELKN